MADDRVWVKLLKYHDDFWSLYYLFIPARVVISGWYFVMFAYKLNQAQQAVLYTSQYCTPGSTQCTPGSTIYQTVLYTR